MCFLSFYTWIKSDIQYSIRCGSFFRFVGLFLEFKEAFGNVICVSGIYCSQTTAAISYIVIGVKLSRGINYILVIETSVVH